MWSNRLFVVYERLASRYPIATNMATSGVLWGSGDIAAQSLEQEHSNNLAHLDNATANRTTGIDWQRVAVQSLYASLLWAPFGHYWYQALDRWAHQAATILVKDKLLSRKSTVLISKVAMEALLLHPIALFAYFTCIGTMKGETASEISWKLRNDFAPCLGMEIALWTPLDVVNFVFVPVRHQLLVVNCGCLLESVGLSYIHRNGFRIFQSPHPAEKQATTPSSMPRSQYMR